MAQCIHGERGAAAGNPRDSMAQRESVLAVAASHASLVPRMTASPAAANNSNNISIIDVKMAVSEWHNIDKLVVRPLLQQADMKASQVRCNVCKRVVGQGASNFRCHPCLLHR